MRTIHLKCESDLSSYDQTVREITVEREDEAHWYGKPIANPACHTLQWPKFAWKEVKHNTGQENARDARLIITSTLTLTGEDQC